MLLGQAVGGGGEDSLMMLDIFPDLRRGFEDQGPVHKACGSWA